MEQALAQANFRYTGARLLDFLSLSVSAQQAPPSDESAAGGGEAAWKTMGDVLLERCAAIRASAKELQASDGARFRNSALFMADLFLQFAVYEGEERKRVPELAEATAEFLEALAAAQQRELNNKEDIRAIAQALKVLVALLFVHVLSINLPFMLWRRQRLIVFLCSFCFNVQFLNGDALHAGKIN